ncbi:MAG: phytoene desaturase family protein [Planctomycetaceae bacterium]
MIVPTPRDEPMIEDPEAIDSGENHYDAIVVGSGMGSLTTASILASVGKKRVLVLESHFKLGGFLHSFRRKKYVWDPGVHYIGEMQDGSMTRRCMDLVTGGAVQWHQMDSPFETFMFPGESFGVDSDPKKFEQDLIDRFPDEVRNIKKYFKDLKSIQGWTPRWFMSKQFSGLIAWLLCLGKGLALKNTREYMEARFDDPLLRAILTAQWPDYGTPPAKSAFGVHATVQADFLNGGYYPIGGSQAIADSAVKVIESYGGKCMVRSPVQEILIRKNQAYGVSVETKNGDETYTAPMIVSGAGAGTTFDKLVHAPFGQQERAKLKGVQNGTSAVVLFLGLNDDPRSHGFTDTNYWLYERLDYDKPGVDANGDPLLVDGGFLSFGSIRNPGQEPHTAQIVCFSEEAEWVEYADKPWLKRGEDYDRRKHELAEAMIDFAEERLPGLRKLIDYQELASPLTFKTFTGHSGGAIYGQESDKNRLLRDQWRIGTSVENLYLTGTDLGVPGVNSALMAGVMTAGKLLGWFGTARVMSRVYSKAKN